MSTTQAPDKTIGKETQNLPDPQTALRLYREGVEELWKLKSEKPISNAVPAHAAILFETFFKHSKNKVRIFCRNLNAEVFGGIGVVQQASEALKRNVSINIIVQEEPEQSAFKELLRNPGVCIQRASRPVSEYDLNFAVMDDEAIRIEPKRSDCKATAIMYAPDKARQLAQFFDQIASIVSPTPVTA
jgi:hypothetical protein